MDQSQTNGEAEPLGAMASLEAILAEAPRGGNVTLGQLFDAMRGRAFGLLLLLLALPCALPFVYLLPQIVALPMLLIAGQMAYGRRAPWLPASVSERSLSVAALEKVVTRAGPWLRVVERVSKPRLAGLSGRTGSRLVGMLLLIPTASILVPLPLTNTVPGIGVAIAAFGLIERDGLLILAGLLLGFTWIVLLILGGQMAVSAIIHWLQVTLS